MMFSTLSEHIVGGRARWIRANGIAAALVMIVATLTLGCETADPDVDESPMIFTGVPQGGGPVDQTGSYDVAELHTALERPAVYTGNQLVGEASVYRLVSPRGFIIESGQERILMVIRDEEPGEQIRRLQRGDRLQLSGELRLVDNTDDLEGELDSYVQTAMDGEEYYLAVSADAVEVVGEEPAS